MSSVSRVTGSDIADAAKNTGVVLTALSGAVYACGYLVLRARAHALGTDPGFALIDQAYVFAGFRFLLLFLFAMLLAAPLLLLFWWVGRRACLLAPGPFFILETTAALSAAAVTIWAYAMTIQVSGVLFEPSSGWLADAVLGRNDYGMLIMLASTTLGTAMMLWAYAHFARAGGFDPISVVLALISVLLLVLLPTQHGVFYADRNAQRLERAPDGVTGLEPPIWLVDRGSSDRVVLYGRATDGEPRLVTLKAEKLDGIAVTHVSNLGTAVGERKR